MNVDVTVLNIKIVKKMTDTGKEIETTMIGTKEMIRRKMSGVEITERINIEMIKINIKKKEDEKVAEAGMNKIGRERIKVMNLVKVAIKMKGDLIEIQAVIDIGAALLGDLIIGVEDPVVAIEDILITQNVMIVPVARWIDWKS